MGDRRIPNRAFDNSGAVGLSRVRWSLICRIGRLETKTLAAVCYVSDAGQCLAIVHFAAQALTLLIRPGP